MSNEVTWGGYKFVKVDYDDDPATLASKITSVSRRGGSSTSTSPEPKTTAPASRTSPYPEIDLHLSQWEAQDRALYEFDIHADVFVKMGKDADTMLEGLRAVSDEMRVIQSPGRFVYTISGSGPVAMVEMAMHAIADRLGREVRTSVPAS